MLGLMFLLAVSAPDWEREVKPLLARRCLACHGAALQSSHLRLDQRASLLKGGESGVPAVEPGAASRSLLIRYVSGADPKLVMPPKGPRLTTAEVGVLERWINAGAVMPDAGPVAEKADPRLSHWSFQPLGRAAPPSVKKRSWVRNPIDAFVLARLEAKGWAPNPPASARDLLRRVSLDLTGLPPTLAEQAAFQGDLDGEVRRLLASPAYGERWARHWLDLVRYGDTNGYERDALKPHVWRYRDWVIQALNDDKPYDRFVTEQLAGDELPDADASTMIAAGFLRLGPWDDEPADPAEDRFDQLDDMVSTTSQAFLGLTLGCARCHNHKFEPLSTRDYYSMVAVFNGLERPRNGRTELDRPAGTRAELARHHAREAEIAEYRRRWLEAGDSRLPIEARQAFLAPKPDEAQKKLMREHQKALEAELARGPASLPLPRAYVMEELKAAAPATHILIRGKAGSPGPEVSPAAPAILAKVALSPVAGSTSGRRLAFAQWLTSRDNALFARVMVNRVWQWHFGQGLVRTASDFGVMGDKPEHGALLDWLAAWFIDHGYSLKQLHALILGSNTYRMSKASNAVYAKEDPENRLWWRLPYRRLEAEALLDSVLAVSGRLNRQMFGPQVYPGIPKEALEGSSDPGKIWEAYDEQKASRRAIYWIVKRSLMVPLLEALDLCDTARTAAQRQTTAVAPQALQLFNGAFVNEQARHFAGRLRAGARTPAAQVTLAYELALARRPTAAELRSMEAFLAEASLEELARVIFNLNEFAYAN